MERWMIISAAVIGAMLALDIILFIAARRQEKRRRTMIRLEQVINWRRDDK